MLSGADVKHGTKSSQITVDCSAILRGNTNHRVGTRKSSLQPSLSTLTLNNGGFYC